MVGESTYVLGAMVPASLPIAHATENVSLTARPLSTNRQLLRRISSLRNAWTLVFLYLQTIAIMWGAITYPLFGIPIAFVLMGRAHAQFASLMHESAHRVLFANKRINDTVGRWLLGFVVFTALTPIAAYTWRTIVKSLAQTNQTLRCTPTIPSRWQVFSANLCAMQPVKPESVYYVNNCAA